MITFDFTKKKNSNEPEDVELTLPLFMEEEIISTLKRVYTIELLQADRKLVDNDHVKYSFRLQQDDADEMKDAILKAYTKYSGFNTEN
jgi:hypothetical protein